MVVFPITNTSLYGLVAGIGQTLLFINPTSQDIYKATSSTKR